MKSTNFLLAFLLTFGLFFPANTPVLADEVESDPPRIQLAILLDTSGSMQGLINQARAQLWKVVNEFATAKKAGVRPTLEVALYEYGKQSIPASEGFLRMIVPLSSDLDRVSEELFALTTNGGNEFCGHVIQAATQGLKWSEKSDDLKVIFIAGNEPFTQGTVEYQKACRDAIARGIQINTIHCGKEAVGIAGKWKDAASLADGRFMNIDHNATAVHIPAPQDKRIAELGGKINDTYLAFGHRGKRMQKRQLEQDANSQKASPGASLQRAVSKASGYYKNAHWDMVDAVKEKKLKLEDMKEEDLPEAMRKMTLEERKAHLEKLAAQRKKLQEEIQVLHEARKKFVAEKQRELAGDSGNTLDRAMIGAVREQAVKKKFQLEK